MAIVEPLAALSTCRQAVAASSGVFGFIGRRCGRPGRARDWLRLLNPLDGFDATAPREHDLGPSPRDEA